MRCCCANRWEAARQIRAWVLTLKARGRVEIAHLSGTSGPEIVFLELMPHVLPWLGANFVNDLIAAILVESGPSILGLGPQNEITLGMTIHWSDYYSAMFLGYGWWWLTPIVTLILLFFSVLAN